jgi:ABC-type spermidine/putrescine transport system permease subunit II
MRARELLSGGLVYYSLLAIFLYLPIVLLIVFSFNDSTVMVFPLKGFTLKWYQELLQAEELLKSVYNSLLVGLAASAAATAFGTLAAIGLTTSCSGWRCCCSSTRWACSCRCSLWPSATL